MNLQNNAMTFNSIFSAIGIGSLIAVMLKAIFDNINKVSEKNFDLKETRYKALIILMWTYINPKREFDHLKLYRTDIKNIDYLRRELILELYEMLLYAGDNAIKIFKIFIEEPTYQNYTKVIVEMRKDLYGKDTKIKFEDIKPDQFTIRVLET